MWRSRPDSQRWGTSPSGLSRLISFVRKLNWVWSSTKHSLIGAHQDMMMRRLSCGLKTLKARLMTQEIVPTCSFCNSKRITCSVKTDNWMRWLALPRPSRARPRTLMMKWLSKTKCLTSWKAISIKPTRKWFALITTWRDWLKRLTKKHNTVFYALRFAY